MLYAICIFASLFVGFIVGANAATRVFEKKLIMHGLDSLLERIKNGTEKK